MRTPQSAQASTGAASPAGAQREGANPATDPGTRTITEYSGVGVIGGLVALLVAAVVVVTIVAQNTDRVAISLFWLDWSMPLGALVLVVALIAAVLTAFVGVLWRRRRREMRSLREAVAGRRSSSDARHATRARAPARSGSRPVTARAGVARRLR
ncbi:MAG: lipopolysaccharide assembly protein LapA domain-containing protein [Acidimicrobiia bacterium]